MRIALAAAISCAIASSGCAWQRPKTDPTEFFVLEATAAARAPRQNPPLVELAEVEVPDYLSGLRMAVRSSGNEIDYSEFRRWAEPLPEGIGRVIREDLSATVDVRPAPVPGRTSGYLLSVRVTAFEGLRVSTGPATALVSASWELRPADARAKPVRGRFEAAPAAWDGKDYRRLARLESEALAALCDDLKRVLGPELNEREGR